MTSPADRRQVGVLLVEDDSIVRAWVRGALDGSEFRVAGEAGSIEAALELVERRAPQLLVVDQHLVDGKGVDLIRQLRRDGVSTPAIVITARREPGLNEEAREAGAQGASVKSGDAEALLGALRAIAAGRTSFDSSHPRRPEGQSVLTVRERQVLGGVAEGKTNRQIADDLGVSPETVKTLLSRASVKLGVGRRAEAVSVALKKGLL